MPVELEEKKDFKELEMGPLPRTAPLAHSLLERKIRRQQQQQQQQQQIHLPDYLHNQNHSVESNATAGSEKSPLLRPPPNIYQDFSSMSLLDRDRAVVKGAGEKEKLRQRQTTLLDYIQVSFKPAKESSNSYCKDSESLKINNQYQQQKHHYRSCNEED